MRLGRIQRMNADPLKIQEFCCTLQYIDSHLPDSVTMASTKTTTMTFRIEPGLKVALRTAAHREHRSISNMVEVLIRDYCRQHDIAIPEQASRLSQDDASADHGI
jgi:hypothetical protein